jgi:hypothetical protein
MQKVDRVLRIDLNLARDTRLGGCRNFVAEIQKGTLFVTNKTIVGMLVWGSWRVVSLFELMASTASFLCHSLLPCRERNMIKRDMKRLSEENNNKEDL